MKKFSSFVMVVLLTTILFCCVVAAALVISNVESVANLSSWAQAVGGIAAIVAAFLVGMAQSKATVEAVRIAEFLAFGRKSRALLAVADEVAKLAAEANVTYATADLLLIQLAGGEYSRPLQTLLDELADIRAHEFGSQTVLSEVVNLKLAASYFQAMIDRMPEAIAAWEAVESNQNLFNHLKDVISINHQLISKAKKRLHELIEGDLND